MDSSFAIEAPSVLHVLLLDPLFRVGDQPHHTRSYEMARRLVRAGHRVSVITTGLALERPPQIDDLTVEIVRATDRSGIARPFFLALLLRIWRCRDVDAVIAAACPASTLALVMLFCFIRGIPFVLDERSVPPNPPSAAPWLAHFLAWSARIVRAVASRSASQVFVTSDALKDALLARSIPAAQMTVSPIGCDPGAWTENRDPTSTPWTGRLALVYAGPIEDDLHRIVDLAAALEAAGDARIAIALYGDGPARSALEAAAVTRNVLGRNLWLMPSAARQALVGIFAGASAVLARANHAAADASTSFYDGLAAGKPLVLLDDGAPADLVVSRGAAVVLPRDGAAAAHELREFLSDGDGLRRASSQAAALGAGRFMMDRILGELRAALEHRVATEPRATVMRRRLLATKRTIDIVVSGIALIALLPIMLAIGVAIVVKMGWPPLFTQERPGLNARLFRVIKFRTMTDARDSEGALLDDEQRLTPLGKFLRRTSLDELPELINVLKGDMSLVGPRPLLPEYLAHYNAMQRRRHDVRPGMTGWSQVNGRNAVSWEERFEADVWYVDNLSLWLDLKIIVKTAWIALLGVGVSAPGHATMPRFDEVMARREGAEDV